MLISPFSGNMATANRACTWLRSAGRLGSSSRLIQIHALNSSVTPNSARSPKQAGWSTVDLLEEFECSAEPDLGRLVRSPRNAARGQRRLDCPHVPLTGSPAASQSLRDCGGRRPSSFASVASLCSDGSPASLSAGVHGRSLPWFPVESSWVFVSCSPDSLRINRRSHNLQESSGLRFNFPERGIIPPHHAVCGIVSQAAFSINREGE